jgi:flagellar motor protein MotB
MCTNFDIMHRTQLPRLLQRLTTITSVFALVIAGMSALDASPASAATGSTWNVYAIVAGPAGSTPAVATVNGGLSNPESLVYDSAGDLIISDQSSVDLVAASNCSSNCSYGLASTVAGDIYTIYHQATNFSARQITLDSHGNIILGMHSVGSFGGQVWLIPAQSCSTACSYGFSSYTAGRNYVLAGSGVNGAPSLPATATSAALGSPVGVALDSHGNVVISTLGNAGNPGLYVLDETACSGNCPAAYGKASMTAGTLYQFTGPSGANPALNAPQKVAFDAAGDLFVANENAGVVEELPATTCTTGCAFNRATTADQWITLNTSLGGGSVWGADVDPYGNVLIANYTTHVIDLLPAATCSSNCHYGLASYTAGVLSVIAGGGASASSVSGTAATATSFSVPYQVISNGTNLIFAPGGATIDELAAAQPTVGSTGSAPGIATATISDGAQGGGSTTHPWPSDVLSATASGVTGSPTPTPSYQWYCNATAISGATASTYTVVSGDVGCVYTVTITETNTNGNASATSAATGSVQTAPTITSATITDGAQGGGSLVNPWTGDVLSASGSGITGTPTPAATYQWYCSATAITGATASTYTVTAANAGCTFSVKITETNVVGTASATSTATGAARTAGTISTATITDGGQGNGTTSNPWVNDVLTATASGVTGSPAPAETYEWYCNGTAIPGATAKTYTVVTADAACTITVKITETNVVGNQYALSAATGPVQTAPTISAAAISDGLQGGGSLAHPRANDVLTASRTGVTGSPAPAETYQWYCNGTAITGATAQTYIVTVADAGCAYSVKVSETNVVSTASATSASTGSVETPPTITSATVTDGGEGAGSLANPRPGDVLQAHATGVTGTPTPTPSYQWFCGTTAIAGATAQTYTVVNADADCHFTVTITETNVVSSASATSVATGPVQTPPTIASATVTDDASGGGSLANPWVGDILSAQANAVTGSPSPTATYQWYCSGSPITNATNDTYQVTRADATCDITVVITESNAVTTAQAQSDPTGPVQTAPLIASATISDDASGGGSLAHPYVGDVLSAISAGVEGSPAPVESYQWYCGATAITGATAATYTVASGDAQCDISVTITETNVVGTANASSEATGDVQTAPTIDAATISDDGTAGGSVSAPFAGDVLTANAQDVTGYPAPAASYQWYCNGMAIAGATNVQYTVLASDAQCVITVAITETNVVASASATSASTGPVDVAPSIASATVTDSGDANGQISEPLVGDVMHAQSAGVTGSPTPDETYQWNCNGTAVTGATSSSLVTDARWFGCAVSVTITETNLAGTASQTSSASGKLAYPTAAPGPLPLAGELSPGQAQQTSGNEVTECGVAPNAALNGLQTTSCSLKLDLSAVTSSGAKVPLNAQNQLVASPGRGALATGDGFAPDSGVSLYIFPEGIKVGHGMTNGKGHFEIIGQIPSTLKLGLHTIEVVGYSPADKLESANMGIIVEPALQNHTYFYFGMDQAQLSVQAKASLHEIALVLPRPSAHFALQIVGYTEPTLTNKDWQYLSLKRAQVVANYLTSLGVKVRISVQSGGNAALHVNASRYAVLNVQQ